MHWMQQCPESMLYHWKPAELHAPATMDAVPFMCSHINNRLGFDNLLFAEIFKLNPPVFVMKTGGFI